MTHPMKMAKIEAAIAAMAEAARWLDDAYFTELESSKVPLDEPDPEDEVRHVVFEMKDVMNVLSGMLDDPARMERPSNLGCAPESESRAGL